MGLFYDDNNTILACREADGMPVFQREISYNLRKVLYSRMFSGFSSNHSMTRRFSSSEASPLMYRCKSSVMVYSV